MLEPTQTVKPATGRVVAKVIDGEAMIMDIRSGVYHSLDNVGAFIWESIELGLSLEDIANSVTSRFDVSIESARQDLMNLINQLLEEEIVFVKDADSATPVDVSTAPRTGKSAYITPVLQTYHDMGDLLALDPPAPSATDLEWED